MFSDFKHRYVGMFLLHMLQLAEKKTCKNQSLYYCVHVYAHSHVHREYVCYLYWYVYYYHTLRAQHKTHTKDVFVL